MKFYAEIDTENSAFEDGDELSTLLETLAGRVAGYRNNHPANNRPTEHTLQDSNGNTCGRYGFKN